MGKISNALDKYRQERRQVRKAAAQVSAMMPQDWDVLLRYNRKNGQVNLHNRKIIKDSGTIHRLLANNLILPDGRLTQTGRQKCEAYLEKKRAALAGEESRKQMQEPLADAAEDRVELHKGTPIVAKETKEIEAAVQAGNLVESDQIDDSSTPAVEMNASDWSSLMEYDRDTGNLLKYDSETGKLDDRSRAILRDPEAIQRMIDNKMILPGGWLTREAKQACEKREHGIHRENDEETAAAENKQSKLESKTPASDTQAIPEQEKPREESPKIVVLQKDAVEDPVINVEELEPENKTVKRSRKRSESHAVDRNLVSLLDPLSFEAEQFKILRSNLLFPVSGPAPRSILVTSTVPGEGKSFVASNLAVAIAQDIDRYVLVVDCDLRQPKIHKQFGFGEVPGLSDYLANDAALPDLLLNTRVNKLTILPAGKPPPNPSELLSSEKMAALIEEITERYKDRMIIIDSPPPKLTAESSFLARKVDGIVLVVKHGKTRREDVNELVKKFGKDKILGSIINQFDIKALGYYGYKKYGKHGHYYSVKS